MQDWLETMIDPAYVPAAMWILIGLAALIVLYILMRIVRAFTSGTFIAGGRNRKARLSVMDAAPIDAKRRIVLVRRDDVEHLLLIGGPTDVVVERDIRMIPRAARPTPETAPVREEPAAQLPPRAHPAPTSLPPRAAVAPPPRPAAPERPAPEPPKPAVDMRAVPPVAQSRPQPPSVAAPSPAAETRPSGGATTSASAYGSAVSGRPGASTSGTVTTPAPSGASSASAMPRPLTGPASTISLGPTTQARTPPSPPAAGPKPASQDELDDVLMRELEGSLDVNADGRSARPAEGSLEDEMTKLLGELSRDRK